jgi:hypothetical protein
MPRGEEGDHEVSTCEGGEEGCAGQEGGGEERSSAHADSGAKLPVTGRATIRLGFGPIALASFDRACCL